MKTFNLKPDYGIKESEVKGEVSMAEVTVTWVTYAVKQKHKDLNGSNLRTWGRLQRKFDDALLDKRDTLELEEGEAEFVKNAFSDEVSFPSDVAKYVMVLQDEIAKL